MTRQLRLLRWREITDETEIPPLGAALAAHINEYRNPVGRAASAAAWALLYDTLLEAGVPPGTVAFAERGKPYFTDVPVFFSVSHSFGVAAVSVADVPTGVDVERCDRPVRRQLWEKCVSTAEAAAFGDDFFRLWCRKESIVKLTGEGLSDFPLRVDALDARYAFREELLSLPGGEYRLTAAFSLEHTT